jgi:glycosyltransferase involved in cell wall biosynthesis
MGGIDYVHKPFYNDDLLARVKALVNRPNVLPAHPEISWGNSNTRRPKVSVVIPTLNEADNLPLIFPYFPMNWVDEVILVDGCSTDGTIEVARQLFPSIKVVLEKTPGKGAALQAGYRAAAGDILVVLDADGSHDTREIPRFVNALMEGADFVKGSRFAPGGGTTDMPRYRQVGNGAFVLLTNLLFSATFTDLCYGYHAFWKYCLDAIDLKDVNGFEIDTALYLGALRMRLRITEVPSFEGYRFNGQGKAENNTRWAACAHDDYPPESEKDKKISPGRLPRFSGYGLWLPAFPG